MNVIELVILGLVASGILAYLLGKINAKAGSVVTIFATLGAFGALAYYGYYIKDITVFNDANQFLDQGVFQFLFSELGLFFAVIVSFVFFMVSFFNPYFVDQYKYKAAYPMLFLFALAGSVGVFFAQNLLYLFFFFEFVVWTSLFLIPMGRSKKAASWYYGFSALGGFALLFAILLLRNATGSFALANLATYNGGFKTTIYLLFMVAGFSKLGAFPFHIWLPKVLTNSPDPITAVFSGGLEKLGAFVAVLGIVKLGSGTGMLSLNGYINMEYANYVIGFIGGLTIVFGTLMAIRQDDAKKLLAYSSMSNGGYILVALTMLNPISVSGGLFHVVAHAVASTAAFLAIGAVSRVTGTTKMSELGGMIHKMPVTYVVYLSAIISMAGIPPMGGFISKWLIFQSVIDNGLIFIGIATFFGSIGSFLYVFRPLAALFLGQELPEHRDHTKEAPFFMLLPMVILTLLSVYTGVVPNGLLSIINGVVVELGLDAVSLSAPIFDGIQGNNGMLVPTLISIVFGFGVFVAFIIFILLKKSKKVDLMDTYTAGNFVWTENLLHYSVDFYAPFERLYEKHTKHMKRFYNALANKVREFGAFMKYFFFSNKPEVVVFFILIVITLLLWGDLV